MKKLLLEKIEHVEALTNGSKWKRFLFSPTRYLFSFFYRFLIYKVFKKSLILKTSTFYNAALLVEFPSGNDIFLFGAKTHDSEIRLTKFLINSINEADCFVDVGAHVGFFSLLANNLISNNGKVFSFEPSSITFKLLQQNTFQHKNISVQNIAISSESKSSVFFESDAINSEYNSLSNSALKEKGIHFVQKNIQTEPLDNFLNQINQFSKRIIKIDTEGAELEVLSGMNQIFSLDNTIVIMEYLSNQESIYGKAAELLRINKFKSHFIDKNGIIKVCDNIPSYLQNNNLESDNLVFTK